jgi:hypothetical protein
MSCWQTACDDMHWKYLQLNVMNGRTANNGTYVGDFDVSNIRSLLTYTKAHKLPVSTVHA